MASTQTAEVKDSTLGFKPKKARSRSKVARCVGPYRVDRKFYTSGQAARLLNIPDRTLRRYLSTGKIEGIQHPITGTWQIEKDSLAAFIEKCGCSVITRVAPTRVLVVHDNPESLTEIQEAVHNVQPEATVQTTHDPCNALIQIGEECPDVVIIKADIPGLPCQDILTAIKNNVTTGNIKSIILREDSNPQLSIEEMGADAVISKPCTTEDMMQVFESLFETESN